MVVSHQKELIEVYQANQLSITALKDELEKQNKKAMTELQELHQKDLGIICTIPEHTNSLYLFTESLEVQLKQDHQLSLSTLQSQYNDKLQQSEVKSQEKITHLNAEVVNDSNQMTPNYTISNSFHLTKQLLLNYQRRSETVVTS